MYFFTVNGGACSLKTVNYFRTGHVSRERKLLSTNKKLAIGFLFHSHAALDAASIIYSRLSLFDYEYRYADYKYGHNITHST